MAKKKKSEKPAKQDQAEQAAAGAAPVAPAVVALPPGSVAMKKRDVEHFLAVQRKTKEAEQKWAEADHYKEMKKIAASEAKALDAEIRRMIRNGPDDPALFDKHEEPETELHTAPTGEVEIEWDFSPHADAATAARVGPDSNAGEPSGFPGDEWKAAKLVDVLKLGEDQEIYKATFTKTLGMLAKVEITTVGQLEHLRAEHGNNWLDKVPGLGKVGRDLVTEELDKYLARTRDKAAFDAARGVDADGKRPAPLDFDAIYDVVHEIQQRGEFDAKVTPAKLKKFLKNTLQDGADGVATYACDDDGIHVKAYRGATVDEKTALITYQIACDIISGRTPKPLADAPAEQSPPFDEAAMWAELLRYFVERWRIAGPMNTNVLKNVTCPAAGKFRIFEWTNADDGIHVHTPDAVEHVLSYKEAAAILKTFEPSEFYDPNAAAKPAAAEKPVDGPQHADDDPRLIDVATMIYEDPRLNFGTEFDAEELCEQLAGKFGENAKLRWDGAADGLVVSTVGKGARKLTDAATASYERIAKLLRDVVDMAYATEEEPDETDDDE